MQLLACYEGKAHDGPLSPFHPLNGEIGDDSLWNFLNALCEYGGYEDNSSNPENPKAAVQTLLQRETQVLSDGIVVVAQDFRLLPSCCCGLEDWNSWKAIIKGSFSPWLGHDPDPWVDTSGDTAILHNGFDADNGSFEVSYEELSDAVHKVANTLSEFLERLRAWLKDIDPDNSEKLSKRISEWFKISPLTEWPEHLFDGIDWEA